MLKKRVVIHICYNCSL